LEAVKNQGGRLTGSFGGWRRGNRKPLTAGAAAAGRAMAKPHKDAVNCFHY
jgi:hypothetical protein